jgi:hypothetical protein
MVGNFDKLESTFQSVLSYCFYDIITMLTNMICNKDNVVMIEE